MQIHDISPPLSPNLAVFPGDTKFSLSTQMDFALGHHLKLTSIISTPHAGAHADAPSHFHPDGVDIASRSLNLYFGQCQVIHLKLDSGQRITPADIQNRLINSSRILFRTDSFSNFNEWRNDFNSLSPELIHFLKSKGVVLVGIDTPSVDPAEEKVLSSHQALYQTDMAVLEGLDLSKIAEANYLLVAFPLKISGGEAAPVRAVLIDGDIL